VICEHSWNSCQTMSTKYEDESTNQLLPRKRSRYIPNTFGTLDLTKPSFVNIRAIRVKKDNRTKTYDIRPQVHWNLEIGIWNLRNGRQASRDIFMILARTLRPSCNGHCRPRKFQSCPTDCG